MTKKAEDRLREHGARRRDSRNLVFAMYLCLHMSFMLWCSTRCIYRIAISSGRALYHATHPSTFLKYLYTENSERKAFSHLALMQQLPFLVKGDGSETRPTIVPKIPPQDFTFNHWYPRASGQPSKTANTKVDSDLFSTHKEICMT